MAPPALAAIYFGPPYLQILLAAVALVLAWEWLHLCGDRRDGITAAVFAASLFLALALTYIDAFGPALLTIAIGAALVFAVSRLRGRGRPLWLALGVGYIGLPILAMIWIWLTDEWGRASVLWIVAVVIATDSGAYFAGRAVGGPRLAPRISPRKTWAGLLGGMTCAALVGLPTAFWLGVEAVWLPIVAGAVLAVVSQGGDLAESAIKRHFGVKDMSGIIPGHGGLFDRLDGLIAGLVAVAAAEWISGSSVFAWP